MVNFKVVVFFITDNKMTIQSDESIGNVYKTVQKRTVSKLKQ